ncbi:MAG: hypothetical protein RIQ33_2258 [Bacteroidota bacterium]|jgi:mRNA-degrading endonuclease RelE of RelBE toxin-antitoxin system
MKTYQLVFQPRLKTDIQMAYDYYEFRQQNLGETFLERLEEKIHFIQQVPFAFQLRFKNCRVATLKQFPYGLLFEIDEIENKIIVLALLCHYQNPMEWLNSSE